MCRGMMPRVCLPAIWLRGMATIRSWTSCCWQALPWTCRGASQLSMVLWGPLPCTLQPSMVINRCAKCHLGWPPSPPTTPSPLHGLHSVSTSPMCVAVYGMVISWSALMCACSADQYDRGSCLLICMSPLSTCSCICLRALIPPSQEAISVRHMFLTPTAGCAVRSIQLCLYIVCDAHDVNVICCSMLADGSAADRSKGQTHPLIPIHADPALCGMLSR